MPHHSEAIDLEVPGNEAERACRGALSALGWVVSEAQAGELRAFEDPAHLNCRTSPSKVEITIHDLEAGHTAVVIKATAPGIGPIPGPARVKRQIAALERRIRSAGASR